MAEPSSKMDQITTSTNTIHSEETVLVPEEEIEELKHCLPKANFCGSEQYQLIRIQDFWYPVSLFHNILTCQRHFVAQDTDLVVTSFPKTGTTWLKSLLFSVVNRFVHPPAQSPLLSHNPHELVYDLETGVYGGNPKLPRPHQLNELPSPRLLHSHMPYASLPESIKDSSCKILYICRNPLDTLVSHWHFYPNVIKKSPAGENFQPPNIEDFFEDFCQGKVFCGPYFDHALGYWKQSLEHPDKVLFLKYEDLKENPKFILKKLAAFIGMPFSPQEEKEGVIIEDIIKFCSINNLRELEVNKNGFLNKNVENKTFFREGAVRGWTQYLTDSMAERMQKLMEQKFGGSKLSFQM